MISCRLLPACEQAKWDEFIARHLAANPYQLFAWGQAVEEAYGHTACYFVAEQDNKITAVLPGILFKRPLSKAKLISLPFCDVGGILATDPDSEQTLVDFVQQWARDNNCESTEIRQGGCAVDAADQTSTQKVRMLMPMSDNAETLLASFKSKLRSQIKKAEKNGLTVELSSNPSAQLIEQFYSVFSLNMRALGSPVHSKKWFESIIKYYQSNLVMVCVYFESKPIGVGIVIKNGTKASIPWASTDADYNRLAPNMLLYWQLLAHCADNGINEFDFGRSTLGESTYKFKKQWGAVPYELNWAPLGQTNHQNVQSKNESSSDSSLRELVAKCWSNLPLPIANTCGPVIRKYISL